MNSNRVFLIQFSSLLILIFIAMGVLYKLPSLEPKKDSSFLMTLQEIEGSLDEIEFAKKIKKSEVVLVTKKVVEPIVVKVHQKVKRDKINKNIKPASENIININSTVAKSSQVKKIERKFNHTHDFRLALKLSKLYFLKKSYKQAVKWSMIANELNEKDENSWIMFAKSKMKLGDVLSAKSALRTYSKVYKSKKVRKLLNRMSS